MTRALKSTVSADEVPVPGAVAERMTPQVATAGRDEPLSKARRAMLLAGIDHLPVVRGGAPVGVLVQRDLAMLEVLGVRLDGPAVQAMRTDVCVADADDPLDGVVARMAEAEAGCAVVLRDGAVVGVFTAADALRAVVVGAGDGVARGPDLAARARAAGGYELVVIAASAGGVRPLLEVLGALPRAFPLAVVVVLHRAHRPKDLLPPLLRRAGPLPVVEVVDGARLAPGTVHLAPADLHVAAGAGGVLGLHDGRRISGVLSSADPILESAARELGPRVIAVVLSGSGADGSAGVRAVHAAGGTAIVQEVGSAGFPGMPASALATGGVDLSLPVRAIGPALVRLAREARPAGAP